MNKLTQRSFYIILFSIFTNLIYGQSSQTSGNNYVIYALIAVGFLLFLGVLLSLASNLIKVEADTAGVKDKTGDLALMPGLGSFFRKPLPKHLSGVKYVKLNKGFDIKLKGSANKETHSANRSSFAIKPTNFLGLSPIPKMDIEVGAEVEAGDVLFHDKKNPQIKYVSPVSGEVMAVNRGAKRAITEVVILADKENKFKKFEVPAIEKANREELVDFLLSSGLWPLFRQRPFHVLADFNIIPRDIFISTFDTAPLAPDLNFVVSGNEASFQKGLDVLAKLTSGSVHLGLDADNDSISDAFRNAEGVEKTYFSGIHPAGNVGVQIHHIAPISPADKVWTLDIQSVVIIGRMFLESKFDSRKKIAVTGADLENPAYVESYIGASIKDLVAGQELDNVRYVSGDLLSGEAVEGTGFINFYDDQISVIKEGDHYELFGWLLPLAPRPSTSYTFPNFLMPNFQFEPTTNTHGEKRAFVMTGQYEKVLPMDIYPQHLMKAILTGDFERMEGLGIHELVEEDVALCEFACTSKMPLQSILRDGMDMMLEQG